MKKLLLISITALFLATSAGAQNSIPSGSLKTDKWFEFCNSKELTLKALCAAYAHGLYDGLILWHANSEDPIKMCVPESSFLNPKKMVDIGLDYIKRHGDSGPRPIAVVLREAFEEAFPYPCRQG